MGRAPAAAVLVARACERKGRAGRAAGRRRPRRLRCARRPRAPGPRSRARPCRALVAPPRAGAAAGVRQLGVACEDLAPHQLAALLCRHVLAGGWVVGWAGGWVGGWARARVCLGAGAHLDVHAPAWACVYPHACGLHMLSQPPRGPRALTGGTSNVKGATAAGPPAHSWAHGSLSGARACASRAGPLPIQKARSPAAPQT